MQKDRKAYSLRLKKELIFEKKDILNVALCYTLNLQRKFTAILTLVLYTKIVQLIKKKCKFAIKNMLVYLLIWLDKLGRAVSCSNNFFLT